MKSKINLIILVLASIIIAQSCCVNMWKEISVDAGIQGTGIGGESTSYSPAIGAQAGASLPVACFCDAWTLRPGLVGSLQGAAWEDDWGEGMIKGRTTLFYANLPLVARYQFKNGIYGEAGVQPGILLSAKDKYDRISTDWSDYIRPFDFGIPIGVGYAIDNNIDIGLRVIPGITNINEGEYDSYNDHNFVVALKATYTFRLK